MEQKEKELVSRLSYEVVSEVAPDEIDLFDDFQEEFFNNPDAFLEKDPEKRERMLGFAIPEGAQQFITGVVLPIAWGVIKKYVSRKVDEFRDDDKIENLRDEIFNDAISLGIDKEKAEHLATSLSGKIVTLVK